MADRRDFLKAAALAGASVAITNCGGGGSAASTPIPTPTPTPTPTGPVLFAQSPLLRKFVAPLPGLGGTGIPLASAATTGGIAGADVYNLTAGQYTQLMHPDLPKATKLWGYSDNTTGKFSYLGPIIVAQRGRPVYLRMKNNLPATHILPIDTSLMGAEMGAAANRIAVHLHGGLVPWTSDGGPFSWFSPAATVTSALANDGTAGQSFLNGIAGQPGTAQYFYPNNQSARLMWYHDHAIGITRLNAYAGLASAYLMVDPVVTALTSAGVVPGLNYTIPLILQEKSFKPVDDQWGQAGDLWYPSNYTENSATDPRGRWDDILPPSNGFLNEGKPPVPSCVPEFFGDTPVINGMAYPYVQVEPRRYRVVFLNGSQARFFNLNLFYENTFQAKEPDFTKPGPAFLQVGNEGGLLPYPVVWAGQLMPQWSDGSVDPAGPHNLLLAPAERADVIIDFSSCSPGDKLIMYNDAPAPFPGGDVRNDYYTGDPDQTWQGGAPTTKLGYGPNTRTMMQFQVVARQGAADPFTFASTLSALQLSTGLPKAYADSHIPYGEPDLDPSAPGVLFEVKTLNEDFDEYGRLIQRLGTGTKHYSDSYGLNYIDPPTEVYQNGQVVVWDIYNTTGDTHPMHFHLANVQVIGSAPFTNVGTPDGPFAPPDANYAGWKETVRMNPGEVTRVIMKFSLTATPSVPLSPRFPGMNVHEYVWHCHILEHEEHDMMRPLLIRP